LKLWVDKLLVRIIRSKDVEANGSTTSNFMSFFGLLLLAYGVIRINESLSFPSKWALIPVLGAVLIISSGSKAWLNRIFLMNPIAVWFGLISYPLIFMALADFILPSDC
jgi:peptidoglycan/LPS O-acetylase OafA/YrhL